MLEQHIEQLAKELETQIPVDEKKAGTYHLSLDHNIPVDITELGHPHPPSWEFRATLAEVPHELQEQLFTKMLQGNLFGQGTRQAVLGLDEGGKKLVLISQGSLPIDYQPFHNLLEDFMNIADMWKAEATNKDNY